MTREHGPTQITLSLDPDQLSQRFMLNDLTAGRLYESETSQFLGSVLGVQPTVRPEESLTVERLTSDISPIIRLVNSLIFQAAEDAFGGKLAPAQSALRRAAAEGEGGIPAIRAISGHASRLRKALTLMGQGVDAQSAAKSVGVFWKAEREFLRQSRAWSLSHLDSVQPDILAADKACKTAGSPEQLLAERLALTIAAEM